ncbi:MAG: pseudouridine synthase [Syntrophaceae bacterium CG2_30_49_12]|nr:MAG: pseudouridine synthase [Syntrophaceae bacterium CG2_30_49_12]PIP05657.1 MAG: pseudouridine synthase [Syntrophobacterales bacterium CG23_combo_of_CG06-09_8_20_14_all_48_27]PJA49358.1 MAG: pseudouridine synthase [Syntrophobacterales bacterium CG_4_9_14_3_um_filter_49_8]PJC74966.1 MAG: pseudouridine synthase [Syntrophobacterales bacterium CG_4_8_14_3_um_filter_49_14]
MEERLQKIIARAGFASRRAAEKMIKEGRVRVNNAVVRQLGTKADVEKDEVRVDGNLISSEVAKIYLMLHKPGGYVTTLHDPQGRPIITDLLSDVSERVFPVGRLDYDSEGLLLMTNDGVFAQRLLHPRFGIPKTYKVKIRGDLTGSEIRDLEKGIELDDGKFRPEAFRVEKTNRKSCWVSLTITEGRSRMIRRGFASLGHPVVRLIRVAISDVSLGDLKAGAYRSLTKREVQKLLLP